MKAKRYTQAQIIGILKEHEAGVKVADLVRKHGGIGAKLLPLEVEVRRHGGVGSQASTRA